MEEEVLGKAYDSRLMRRLLVYMRPYWRLVAVSVVFLLAQSALQVLGPLLTKTAIDRYLDPNPHRISTFLDPLLPADPWAGLTRIGLIYLSSCWAPLSPNSLRPTSCSTPASLPCSTFASS